MHPLMRCGKLGGRSMISPCPARCKNFLARLSNRWRYRAMTRFVNTFAVLATLNAAVVLMQLS